MPRVTSSWSRSEWLRRLGFKTGDQPPLASSIMPTLRSGDASELVPPLLAPQGYAQISHGPVAGAHSTLEVRSVAPGGCWVAADSALTGIFFQWMGLPSATYTAVVTPTVYLEQPDMLSLITVGDETAPPASVPTLGLQANSDVLARHWYVPNGQALYFCPNLPNTTVLGYVHVRDVPVGLAAD